MKKMNNLICTLVLALPLVVSNFAHAFDQTGTAGPGWAMPVSFPANPGYPAEYGPGFGGPFYGHHNRGQDVTCESRDFKRRRCTVDGFIRDVRVLQTHSSKPCVEGRSWGWERNQIWVDNGCRATFRVQFGGRR